MRVAHALRPKEPRNLKATATLAGVLVAVFAVASYLRPWTPGQGLGLFFGFFATILFVFEMLYAARRPRARPLLTAKNWLQTHIYLGLIGLVAAFVHFGFRWPQGGIGWGLFALSAWTTLAGLVGVWLQKHIPLVLASGLRVEALYERIPALVGELQKEADELMEDASDVLDRFYHAEVRPQLEHVSPSWSYLLDVRAGRDRALEPFRRIAQFVEEEEKERVEDLMDLYTEKMELDAHYSLQGILRRWPVLHVPAAGLLVGLLAVHVFAWAWY